jgi:cation diffusion facilitator family transporter
MTQSNRRKQNAALASIGASAVLTLAKALAGVMAGSLALLSEAAHGVLDTGATIMTYFAVRAADKPADANHPYGHGKFEALAALSQTFLLLVLATGVLVEALRRLATAALDVEPTRLTFAVLALSMAVDFIRWRKLSEIAQETRSDALAADALHFSSDLVSSCLVMLGLIAAHFGFPQGDALAAVGVALFIGIAGYRLGRRTVDTLVDAAPLDLTGRIRDLVEGVPGVVNIDALRLRPAGAQTIGEVTISVPRTLSLERAAQIKAAVSESIHSTLPEADVTVTVNPRALDNETVFEQVLLIAARRRLPVHHVTVQDVGGRKSVSLDVELDGAMQLGPAHAVASALEAAIQSELGADIEVETHIEPLEIRELTGNDADPAATTAIGAALRAQASKGGVIRDVHSVRVRQTSAGLVVNYHCLVDPRVTVDKVHDEVDRIERPVRAAHPAIVRIVGHAEPLHGGSD